MSDNLPQSSNRKSVTIPVTVITDSRPTKRPPAPAPVLAQPRPLSTRPEPPQAAKKTSRPSVDQLPLEHRRRLMWGIVASGMTVALIAWGVGFSRELKSPHSENGLLTGLSSFFKSIKFPGQNNPPRNTEITNLEKEVFPQFQ